MNKQYLITTSDYPPQLGGLSTFCKNLEGSLQRSGIKFDVFHWRTPSEFKRYCFKKYSKIIHVHPWGSVYQEYYQGKVVPFVNFYHGSEVLFKGNSILKTAIKKIIRPLVIRNFEQSQRNIFISDFTFNKLITSGLRPNYMRDIVFHNTINQGNANFIDLKISKILKFICVARDVPHKNLQGCIDLCEKIQKENPLYVVELFLTSKNYNSKIIKVVNISDHDDSTIQDYYKQSHFNLLLSQDHSDRGYYEGFGLTCLEAANFATPSIVSEFGGLPENVHDGFNGIIIKGSYDLFASKIKDYLVPERYLNLRKNTFSHNSISHGEKTLDRIWSLI